MLIAISCMVSLVSAQTTGPAGEVAVRRVIHQFEEGLSKRDLSKIEPLMAADLVALENGHRNDGWTDFRDHHLVPEMKEPAPESKTELVKIKVSKEIAWAYTKTDMQMAGKDGDKVNLLLWSTYILEKRGKEWKIVLLDWSMRRLKPAAAK
ncbi:MAG TPA: nuclear transport factor 2 family protein [Terriglobales bacterium]|nr:nuclear transport factor 2 family protein [Terriglobales bacterium]